MSQHCIGLSGHVTGADGATIPRLAAVALRGNVPLASAPVGTDGSFHIKLPHAVAHARSGYSLDVAILPRAVAGDPGRAADAPRARILRHALKAADKRIDVGAIALTPELIDLWSIFWQEWCVSGTLVGADGCPAPAAAVTVSTVTWFGGSYSTQARATGVTDINGHFTLCFEWFEGLFCWPCEPVWWDCWPWWWEQDILHVIATLETRTLRGPSAAALFRPDAKALIRGQGFASAQVGPAAPDAARTALIARKFADPKLREIFPWRWWCHHEPNVIFSAEQAGLTVLSEDPALDTRWGFESGQSVTLTGNAQTLTTCTPGVQPESGAVWTSVGNFVPGTTPPSGKYLLDANGLGQVGGAASDMAFAGSLDLYAALEPSVAFYQVSAAVLDGLPSRTTLPVTAGAPFTVVTSALSLPLWIYEPVPNTLTQVDVVMGPFSVGGIPGYYATPAARAAGPIAGLPAFPTVSSSGAIYWGEQGLVLQPDAGALLGGAGLGAVELTLEGFDSSFAPLTLEPDVALRLTIDTRPLTTAQITSLAPTSGALPSGGQCPAFDLTADTLSIGVSVTDADGFLGSYELDAEWGIDNSLPIPPGVPPGAATSRVYSVADGSVWTGGTDSYVFPGGTAAPGVLPSCCYEFRLTSTKRVTDGYTWLPQTVDFRTANITL